MPGLVLQTEIGLSGERVMALCSQLLPHNPDEAARMIYEWPAGASARVALINAMGVGELLRLELQRAVAAYEERGEYVAGIANFSCEEWRPPFRPSMEAPGEARLHRMMHLETQSEWSFKSGMARSDVEEAQYRPPMEQLVGAFREFDDDDDGYVPIAKLKSALTSLGDPLSGEEMAQLLESVDSNKDQLVSCEEFVNYLQG
eukprot:TRINITY_DN14840_c0_g3_i8.p1 TRINITY_DN14840_c0_g3~~TRINITY_DN14840_c0_g3_i8.p1  ORF type:complete len:202 (-),score=45.26 TRINITY_DN14840_c0_g3_i8:283-888(-)